MLGPKEFDGKQVTLWTNSFEANEAQAIVTAAQVLDEANAMKNLCDGAEGALLKHKGWLGTMQQARATSGNVDLTCFDKFSIEDKASMGPYMLTSR